MTAASISERALIIAERDALVADLHRMCGNQLAIRAGYMHLDENPLLDHQLDVCRRHLTRLESLLGNETADRSSTLDGSCAAVGRREQA